MVNDERRRDLEQAAYGQAASAEESAAARAELERIAGVRGARARGAGARGAAVREAGAPESVGEAEMVADEEVADPAPHGSRRRRVIGAVAAAFVVGLAAGALLEGAFRPSSGDGTSAVGAVSPSADPSGDSRFDSDPSVVESSREKILAAEALLARAAAKTDPYPTTQGANVTYIPSSTRLVSTTPAGTRVWIAREAGKSGGYCLLSLDASKVPNQGLALSSCSLPDEFVNTGVGLTANGYDVTWKGGRITVNLGD